MGNNIAYSPSEVKKWLICPVYRKLSRGWKSRVTKRVPGLIIGRAIHAGIAARLSSQTNAPIEAANDIIEQEKKLGEPDELSFDRIHELVKKGLKAMLEYVGNLIQDAEIIGVEDRLLYHGKSRVVDCLLRRGMQYEVCDWKVRTYLSERRVEDTLLQPKHSWQLLDYVNVLMEQQQIVLPCVVREATLVLAPTIQVLVSTDVVDRDRLESWRSDASIVWGLMEAITPWHNLSACTNTQLHYGARCEFFEWCHVLRGKNVKGLYQRKDHGEAEL